MTTNLAKKLNTDWQSRKWLAHILGLEIEKVLGMNPKTLEKKQWKKYQNGQKKLERGYPLDYLLGQVDFCNHQFVVSQGVLVPRPETEEWVQKLILELKTELTIDVLVDVATGSGVVGLSLLIALSEVLEKAILSDIDQKALRICKQNVAKMDTNKHIKVVKASGLPVTEIEKMLKGDKKWILVANLPYLPEQKEVDLELKFEPQIALYSGLDGLDCYNQVLAQIQKMDNKPTQTYFELDPRNIRLAQKHLQALGYTTQIWLDFNGFERVLVGKIV